MSSGFSLAQKWVSYWSDGSPWERVCHLVVFNIITVIGRYCMFHIVETGAFPHFHR